MTVNPILYIAKIEAYGYQYFESHLVIFLMYVYILICGLIQFLFNKLEKLCKTCIGEFMLEVKNIENPLVIKGFGWC